eukprot:4285477-Pleurochrysis_carterae.AAC.1
MVNTGGEECNGDVGVVVERGGEAGHAVHARWFDHGYVRWERARLPLELQDVGVAGVAHLRNHEIVDRAARERDRPLVRRVGALACGIDDHAAKLTRLALHPQPHAICARDPEKVRA